MSKSSIEWTEQTWNPVVGCSIVSPGCTNCYAMKTAARNEAMGISRYDGTTRVVNGNAVWTGNLAQAPESTLLQPLKRKKPTTYFVNSMGDLFHEDCPDAWIDRVFAVMALCPQHTFQVLTKRAGRMRDYFEPTGCINCGDGQLDGRCCDEPCVLKDGDGAAFRDAMIEGAAQKLFSQIHPGMGEPSEWLAVHMPLPNVWLGVSTERQQEADERIPLLLQTPAAVRFISAEPLLGPIDLTRIKAPNDPEDPEAEWFFDALATGDMYEQRVSEDWEEVERYDSGDGSYRETKLDWVIVGGESGPKARPMHPDGARSLRDQCAAAGVPFFFKQWGEWEPGDGDCVGQQFYKVGKARAGRLLDGVDHNSMPGARS